MKSINYLVFFVFALTLTVASCKKDEENKSTKEILTSHSWKMSSQKYNGEVFPIDECERDDYVTFSANGTYTFSGGAIKCDIDETDESGSWTLSEDGKTLTVDGDPASVEITEGKIIVTISDGGYTIEMTYVPV